MPGRMGWARVVGIEGGESGVPRGSDRLPIAPEAAVPGKVAPGLKAEVSLEVSTAERFTLYLRAIQLCVPSFNVTFTFMSIWRSNRRGIATLRPAEHRREGSSRRSATRGAKSCRASRRSPFTGEVMV